MFVSVVAFAALLACASAVAPPRRAAAARSQAPSYSGRYFVEGVFKIPYSNTNEPITAWTDVDAHRQKVEYYGGQDTYLYRYDLPGAKAYEIVPIVDRFGCFATNVTGPASTGGVAASLPAVLPLVPDVSSWQYVGPAVYNGASVDQFQTVVTNVTQFGTGHSYYTMSVDSQSRVPVSLEMKGINFIMGSHPDIYVFDYHQFREVSSFDADTFAVPDLCTKQNQATSELKQRRAAHRLRAIHASLGRVVPPMHTYLELESCAHSLHAPFVDFTLQHRKRYHSCEEHEQRQNAFIANAAFVESWNADASNTHKVELNFHADMTDAEYRDLVLLPRDGAARREAHSRATASQPEPTTEELQALPSRVDWLAKGAVPSVQDQGACGSCWTFGSSEALSSAYAVKTGVMIDISEQQIVDCAWGYVSSQACDGGFAPGAYEYIMQQGGAATEIHYPYLAQDGWCNPHDLSSGVQVTGYVNITGTAQLMSALQNSAVAIAIDASLPSFRFYKSGVYSDSQCQYDLDSLDHEVLVYGYDTNMGSSGAWMVRNSWSTHWGYQGDVLMTMDVATGCGVASQATRPIV